jgi:pimeloyl-ACP methyl ester carboxylesterase
MVLFKKTLALVALFVLVYLLVVGLLWWKQDRLLYQGLGLPPPLHGEGTFVLSRPGLVLHGWVENPGQKKAVVFFGGNAMAVESFAPFLARQTGRTVYVLPYRGFEGQPGTPSQEVLVDDAVALVESIESGHPDGIALLGVSLGSGVAVQVAHALQNRPAHASPVDRLVLVTPYDSIANVARAHIPFIPASFIRDKWNSAGKVADLALPVWVLRASLDTVVPPSSTDRLLAAFHRPVGVEWMDTTHNGVWDDSHIGKTAAFLHRALDGPAPPKGPPLPPPLP